MRLLTIALTSVFLIACSDDSTAVKTPDKTSAPTPDKGTPTVDKSTTPKEASAPREASLPKEAGAKADFPAAGSWTCVDIANCQMPCGTNTTCIDACKTKGCASAVTAINALSACAIAKCLTNCLGGFNAQCEACAKAQCTTEYPACQSNKC